MKPALRILLWALALLAELLPSAMAADWPMWRHDAGRSGASPQALPANLTLQWVRELPPPVRAWPDEPLVAYDATYAPVVAGETMYLGSTVNGAVLALDAATGRERWRTYTEGPVRLAPAVWQDRVYVVSDDGCLYCLEAASGKVAWKFRGAPQDRTLLGNERLISAWPARGGPVVADGVVYFSAGLWPMLGTFFYAVQADTGQQVWLQDGCSMMFILQPHDSPAFSGPAPQGYLAVSGNHLLAPGRSTPVCLDRATGALSYFHLAENNKTGNADVYASERWFINDGQVYRTISGNAVAKVGRQAIIDGAMIYGVKTGLPRPVRLATLGTKLAPAYGIEQGTVCAYQATVPEEPPPRPRKGTLGPTPGLPTLPEQWRLPDDWSLLCKAGPRLYVGKAGRVGAFDISAVGPWSTLAWSAEIPGTPASALAGADRLFVVTCEGAIYAFGADQPAVVSRYPQPATQPSGNDAPAPQGDELLAKTGIQAGYALVWGVGDGTLLTQLAQRSQLRLIGIDPDAAKVDRLRRQLDAAGWYGPRLSLLVGKPAEYPLPPYLASLIVVPNLPAAGWTGAGNFVDRLFATLRPYGGTAALACTPEEHATLEALVRERKLSQARVTRKGAWTLLTREGPLVGAGQWTHQYADAGNTVVSTDDLVKAPLGLLWFGGVSNANILPRHGHGPAPQVVGGRILLEGPNGLRALDVYTGRLLWETALAGLGSAYNNTEHQPGANALGSNYASAPDGIYVLQGTQCLRLNPDTGAVQAAFTVPAGASGNPAVMGSIKVWQDLLIVTVDPLMFEDKPLGLATWNGTASRRLVALDRHTGQVLWSREAAAAYRHNAIAAGNGLVYCLDRLPADQRDKLLARGITTKDEAQLLALDARTGQMQWSTRQRVFGTWLGFAADSGILVQAGRPSRDMLKDEPKDITAYEGKTGRVLWEKKDGWEKQERLERIPSLEKKADPADSEEADSTPKVKFYPGYEGPCLLAGDTLYTQSAAFDLKTGEPRQRAHPLTGAGERWTFRRTYGCNTAIASRHLLTFRSAAAGYFDLATDGGTGNLGGFKSGCTSNLIAADGVLTAPDYTRTCTCRYQIQSSAAFVPMDDVESWTWNVLAKPTGTVTQVGLNFGAPGDRRTVNGTLWLDFPSVGGPSPDLNVAVAPASATYYRHHASRFSGSLPWVAASGVEGADEIAIPLQQAGRPARRYTVKLVFAEPEDVPSGARVFAVRLQGQEVLHAFDIAREADGVRRGIVRAFPAVNVGDTLKVTMTRTPGSKLPPLLSGIELVAE